MPNNWLNSGLAYNARALPASRLASAFLPTAGKKENWIFFF
jgi:hypothetical protein